MANPTSGFQLSALPQPLSMPSNLGKFDVGETQQAYANALKNTQQTALLGPQTQAAVANAAYQKGLAEQQSRLLAPEEQALIQKYRKDKILAQTEADVGEAVAPGKPKLALAGQQAELSGINLVQNRLNAGNADNLGIINREGIPLVLDQTGKVTPLVSPSVLLNADKQTFEYSDSTPIKTFELGGQTFTEHAVVERNKFGHALRTNIVTLPAGQVPETKPRNTNSSSQSTSSTGGTATPPLAGFGAPKTGIAATASNVAPNAVKTGNEVVEETLPEPITPKNPNNVIISWANNVEVSRDDPLAKADMLIRRANKTAPGVQLSPDTRAEIRIASKKATASINEATSQLDALNEAAAQYKKFQDSGTDLETINKYIPAGLLQAFGHPEAQNAEAMGNVLINQLKDSYASKFRASSVISQYIAPAKPIPGEGAEARALKLNYLGYLKQREIDYSTAVIEAIRRGVDPQVAEEDMSKAFALTSKDSFDAYKKRQVQIMPTTNPQNASSAIQDKQRKIADWFNQDPKRHSMTDAEVAAALPPELK